MQHLSCVSHSTNKQTTSPLSDKWGSADSITRDHTERKTPVCSVRLCGKILWKTDTMKSGVVILTVMASEELRVNCVPVSVWSVSVLTSLTAEWASIDIPTFSLSGDFGHDWIIFFSIGFFFLLFCGRYQIHISSRCRLPLSLCGIPGIPDGIELFLF